MNKAEITRATADKSGLTVKDGEKFLKAFTEVVEKILSKGEEVALMGFGTFSAVGRGARESVATSGLVRQLKFRHPKL
jgi:DNA-binding protein HU-beta